MNLHARPSSVRPLAYLLVLGFTLALFGCKKAEEATTEPAPTLSEDFAAGRKSIETLRRKRWATSLAAIHPLVRWHSKTLNWEAMPEGPEKAQLAAELQELWDTEGQPVAKRLLDLAPAADATDAVHQGITALLEQMSIPKDMVFPARTRFQQAWLPATHDRFKLITQGLQDFLINGKEDRYKIGATGLPALAREGQALKQELSEIGHLFARYQRSRRALAAQQGLIKRILEKSPEHPAALKASAQIREALASSEGRWQALLPVIVNPKAEDSLAQQRTEVEKLSKDLQAVLDTGNASIRPIAKELGFLR